jgi:putative endonuclease
MDDRLGDEGRSGRVAGATGARAEALVADRLRAAGWTILGRNVRLGRRELDLVAVDPGPPAMLVVVEVRWRRGRTHGLPEETLDHGKRARLREGLARLLDVGIPGADGPSPRLPARIDLVVVEPSAGTGGGPPRLRHHRYAV